MPNSLKCIKKFFKIDSSHNALLPNLGIVCYVGSQVLRFASTQIRKYSDSQVLRYADPQVLRFAGSQILSLLSLGYTVIKNNFSEHRKRFDELD